MGEIMNQREACSSVETAKKSYKKPELAVLGSIASLTEGVGGSNVDNGQPNNTKRGNG